MYYISCVFCITFLTSYFFYCVVYSFTFIIIIITVPLSFGCCDKEMSLFVGQIKEILILNLILIYISLTATSAVLVVFPLNCPCQSKITARVAAKMDAERQDLPNRTFVHRSSQFEGNSSGHWACYTRITKIKQETTCLL